MIAETITAKNRPEAIEPYDKTWGVGVSGLDEDISPFPRVNRMLSKTKALFVSKVDTERARIMTESWLEKHKGEPALKRVANCFYDIISQVEIHIEEDELIVGEVGADAWTAPLYPEFSTWLADELDQIDRGEVPDFIDRHNDKYIITDDQRKIIRELWAKWKGVNQGEMIRAEMHPEAKKGSGYIFANDLYTNNGIGHVTADYPKLMKLGYGGLRKLVEAKLAEIKLGDDGDELLKYEFWTAQLISLDAAELYFKRYGALAEKLAAKAVRIGHYSLLDGGVADSIPVRFFESLGYKRNLIILTQPKGFVKKKNPMLPAIRARYLRYPAFVAAVADRHERYNEALSYIAMQEASGKDYVIRPPIPLEIGAMERDPAQLRRVYETGRAVAENQIDKIEAFLNDVKLSPEA